MKYKHRFMAFHFRFIYLVWKSRNVLELLTVVSSTNYVSFLVKSVDFIRTESSELYKGSISNVYRVHVDLLIAYVSTVVIDDCQLQMENIVDKHCCQRR
jgi:hypothetical protein